MLDCYTELINALEDAFRDYFDGLQDSLNSLLSNNKLKLKKWLSITNSLTLSENMYMETPKHLTRSRLSWLPKWLLSGPLLLWLSPLLLFFGSLNSFSLSVEVVNAWTTLYYQTL